MRPAVIHLVALAVAACAANPSAEECAMIGASGKSFSNATLDKYLTTCVGDDDCTLLRAQLGCYTGCPRAIVSARLSAAQTEVAGLVDSVCGTSACMVSEGCGPVRAVCVNGTCRTVAGVGDAGTTDAGSLDGG